MGSSERGAIVSGGLTASFGALVVGFKLAFPDMIVPFGWALALICVGLVGVITTLAFLVMSLFPKSAPGRHEGILHSLSDALADVHDLALARECWSPHREQSLRIDYFKKYQDALTKSRRLIDQIPYDKSTTQTAKDFVQACTIVANDAQQGFDDREARSDVARIAPGLFRYLHEGKSVNRSKVDLPDWCRFEHQRRYSGMPEPHPIGEMLRRLLTSIPERKALPKMTATEQAAAFIERATRDASAGIFSTETSYPRVLAEAKAIARELEGRIGYVERIISNKNPGELRNWRNKLDLQRVPSDDLASEKLAGLIDVECEHVRIVVRALTELDRAIDVLMAKRKRFNDEHAAKLYNRRATKARVTVGNLIKVMEAEA